MRLSVLIIGSMALVGCALAPEPEVPVSPAPLVVPASLPDPMPPFCPLDQVAVTLLSSPQDPPPFFKPIPGTGKKRGAVQTPLEVVTQAHQTARVEPSERGYQGGSGEHVYQWSPGRVYTIYLTKKHGTGIFLPPGERLVSGLYLDGDAFDVKTERAGTEQAAYDAIILRPLGEKGEVETFLLTESGRRYLLHLVIGNAGMLAVTFDAPRGPTQAHAAADAARGVLRPPPEGATP